MGLLVRVWGLDPEGSRFEVVNGFVAGPGMARLDLEVDLDGLRTTVASLAEEFGGDHTDAGFGVVPATLRPGRTPDSNDLSGRYWTRVEHRDGDWTEAAHEDLVDEQAFSQINPILAGTAVEATLDALRQHFVLGRARLLSKAPYNCNSWHRDPEPRVHVPIVTNPGSLMIIDHHCTHLPADGSAYFTDTRRYHTALNGGPGDRVHLVAAVVSASSREGQELLAC